jgi:Cu-Zn family superoxide dismutase
VFIQFAGGTNVGNTVLNRKVFEIAAFNLEENMTRFVSVGMAVVVLACLVAAIGATAASKEAVAVINPASGSTCKGIVRITQDASSVKIVVDLEGLAPESKHAFHVHEFGDCSALDAMSAGSHYDPAQTKHHGMPNDKMSHAGDMGNIEADTAGKAHYELTLQGASIDGTDAPILGRAVIVHANVDDFSQPVGNAGGRIGCGVIGLAKAK